MKNYSFYFLLFLTLFIFACSGLNEKQRKLTEEAISALKKLDAATEVGINRSEYSKLLIDSQSAVNQAIEKLPDEELKQELKLSMESYFDANLLLSAKDFDGWIYPCSTTGDSDNKTADLRTNFVNSFCNDKVFELSKKYKFETQDAFITNLPKTSLKNSLLIVWKEAKTHQNRASVLFDEK